jgi:purine-binding chemotaxis protein CheW
MSTRQFTTFLLRGLYFGIHVSHVQEVLRSQPMTRVPTAPTVVAGLINLRGQIVTALDLRRRLALDQTGAPAEPINLIVQAEAGLASLLVDEIGDVIEVDDALFEPPPATLQGIGRELIRGAYKLQDRLLLILDVDLTVGGWAESGTRGGAGPAREGSSR